nr:MAG TPA_asm: hypothetical protein [Bacteriophage sp.]
MFISCLVKYGSKAYLALLSHIPYAPQPNNTLHMMQRSMRSPIVRNMVGEYDAMMHASKMIANAMIIIATIAQAILFILIMF